MSDNNNNPPTREDFDFARSELFCASLPFYGSEVEGDEGYQFATEQADTIMYYAYHLEAKLREMETTSCDNCSAKRQRLKELEGTNNS